jgi:aryl-alcohol dehydrogenase-like predicted oxidoreductase
MIAAPASHTLTVVNGSQSQGDTTMKYHNLGHSDLEISVIGLGCMGMSEFYGSAQLALAWVLARGDDIVTIPGTKHRTYLEQNLGALDVTLTEEDLARIDDAFPVDAAVGTRY